MSWDYELAGLIGENNTNLGIRGAVIGSVLSVRPLKLSLSSGQFILDESIHDLYIGHGLQGVLEEGDDLMIIASETGQVFFIINKVEKLGSDEWCFLNLIKN